MTTFSFQCLSLLLLGTALGGPPAPVDDEYATKLQAISAEYSQLGESPTVEILVRLDRELRDIALSIDEETVRTRTIQSAEYFRDEYAILGLYIGHWSGIIEYSGALLVKAHRLDPHSPFRAHTLFSTVASAETPHEHDGMPDLNAAFQYIAEFPEGPFISQACEIVATCYDDFYKSLRKFMTEKIYDDDVHMACFKPFMTSQPYEQQLVQVQVLALEFYARAAKTASDARQATAVTKKLENFQQMLGATDKNEFEAWYWCSDC